MRLFLSSILVPLTALLVPHLWSAREADAWFDGDAALQEKFAQTVDAAISASTLPDIHTGSRLIDGEWTFATYQMAAMGYAQVALEHPESHERNIERINRCLDKLLQPRVRTFDTREWGEDALASLDGARGHAGYLGYLNMSLSYARLVDPKSRFARLNNQITAALVRRLEQSPILMVETYPNDIWPPDNTAVVGSIALYDRATGADHSALLKRWADRVRAHGRDPHTGLLYQHLRINGRPDIGGRGSGTMLGAWFLSFLNDPIANELWEAGLRELDDPLAGFGALREYPHGVEGSGDVDSGPLIMGRSVVATGFAIAGARLRGDRAHYDAFLASADLFGAPLQQDKKWGYVFGGPVGNAMMFALLTAQPASKVHR